MASQRELFKRFYDDAVASDRIRGKRMAKGVYNSLCQRILVLSSYKKAQHREYGLCAFFGVYIAVPLDGHVIYEPGSMLLSYKYFLEKKPLITLNNVRNDDRDISRIVGEDGTIVTDYLRNWNEKSTFEDALNSIINILQDELSKQKAEPEPLEPKKLSHASSFNPNMTWEDISLTPTKLGEGAFAEVYKGVYRGRPVAVKIWKERIYGDDKVYLEREIEAQKKLDHPNCLKLYGATSTPEGKPVLVTELADGALTKLTVGRNRMTQQPLSNQQKKEVILEIAKGIAYIHSLGLVHRDLKLDNILMVDGHVKIADFGLARVMNQVEMTITEAGTPLYMAPELVGRQRVTNSIDVYSFGCIVNEIISEKYCYYDYRVTTKQKFFDEVLHGMHPSIFKTLPYELQSFMIDCYKSKRYRPNAEECVKRIEQWDPSGWGNTIIMYYVCLTSDIYELLFCQLSIVFIL